MGDLVMKLIGAEFQVELSQITIEVEDLENVDETVQIRELGFHDQAVDCPE